MLHNSKILAVLLSCLCLNLANAQGITPVGGVTSISTDCGVSGGPITTTGTISGNATPNPQTGTSYAIQNSDCGKLITLSNASAVAVSIAQAGTAGQFASGWFATVKNLGVGTVTITPTTSTIDGAANLALTTNQSIDLYSDGINYVTGRGIGGSSSGANPTATASDVAVNGVASTFMRSDAAPAVQKGSNAQFGLAQGDNVTVTMSAGVAGLRALSHPGYISTWWYPAPNIYVTATGGAPTAATAYCVPIEILGSSSITISSLGFEATTAGTSNAQLALYNLNAANNHAGTLLSATGNISTNGVSGGLSSALSVAQVVKPGWYIVCLQVNDTTVRFRTVNISNPLGNPLVAAYVGGSSLTNVKNASVGTFSTTTGIGAFGTWPDFTSATWNDGTSLGPMPYFQVQ